MCVWVIRSVDDCDDSCGEIETIGVETVVVCAVRERGAKSVRYGIKSAGCCRANGFSGGGGKVEVGGVGLIMGVYRGDANGKRKQRREETGGWEDRVGGGGAHEGLEVVRSSL